jgi:hypothetical protein
MQFVEYIKNTNHHKCFMESSSILDFHAYLANDALANTFRSSRNFCHNNAKALTDAQITQNVKRIEVVKIKCMGAHVFSDILSNEGLLVAYFPIQTSKKRKVFWAIELQFKRGNLGTCMQKSKSLVSFKA